MRIAGSDAFPRATSSTVGQRRSASTAAIALLVSIVFSVPALAEETPDVSVSGAPMSQGLDETNLDAFSLEELLNVVVSASKVQQRLEDAPSIVDVITFQDIRRRGYRTVGEALRQIPGLYVINDQVYQDVGVRGLFSATGVPNEILKVMINGQAISFRSNAVSFLGPDLIAMEAIERIEVIRGPGSALYGANAFLGVINLITFNGDRDSHAGASHGVAAEGFVVKNPAAVTANGAATAYTSKTFGKLKYGISANFQRANRSGLVLPIGAAGYPSPGWDPPTREYMRQNATTRNDSEVAASSYGQLSYKLADHLELGADGHFQYNDRGAEFQNFTFLTHQSRLSYMNGFARVRLAYGQDLQTGLSARFSLAFAAGNPTGNERIYDRLQPGSYKQREFGYRAIDVVAEGRYAWSPLTALTFGVDLTHDLENLLTMVVTNERTRVTSREPGFGNKPFTNVGAYLQWTWNPLGKLNVTLGTRGDYNSVVACNATEWDCLFDRPDELVTSAQNPGLPADVLIQQRGGVQLSSRAAVVYNFTTLDLYAKLIYGSSFKPPSPFQLYHRQLTIEGSSVGFPGIKPQTADTVEASVGLRPVPELKTSVVGFFTRVDNMVSFLKQDKELVGRNVNAEVGGIEASVDYTYKEMLTASLNMSLLLHNKLTPTQRADETDLTWAYSPLNTTVPTGRYPSLIVNGAVNWTLPWVPLNLNVMLSYIGQRPASLVNSQLYNYLDMRQSYSLPAYLYSAVTLSTAGWRPFGKALNNAETVISVSVRNITGRWDDPGSGGLDLPSFGPSAFLKVTQQL